MADIHSGPPIALRVVECFDKIRVSPGNFADRRAQIEKLEYTEEDYEKELEHIQKVPNLFTCSLMYRPNAIGWKMF